jgi:hypothetical protein
VHRKGKDHGQVDALSRPVLETVDHLYQFSIMNENENNISSKSLDLFEDEALLHYLRQGRHINGLSRNQVNRVCRAAAHIEIVDKNLETEKFYFKKLYFKKLTQMRIEERYYWKSLNKDVIKFIKKCEPCKREHKVTAFNHPAIANKINGIFEKIAMDLTFGFPQTVDGYVDGRAGVWWIIYSA